jgi:phospholipid transport system transporter-binding protein
MLTMPSTLTHANAHACVAQWLTQLPMGDGQVVRLEGGVLERFDSSALSAVLALRRHLTSRHQTLDLVDLPPRLGELAALYGVDEWLAA